MVESSVRQSDGGGSKSQMRNSIDTIRGFRNGPHQFNKGQRAHARMSDSRTSQPNRGIRDFIGTFEHSTDSGLKKEPVTVSLKSVSAGTPTYSRAPKTSRKRAYSHGLENSDPTNDLSSRPLEKKRSLVDTASPCEGSATARTSSDVSYTKENRHPELVSEEASEATIQTLWHPVQERSDVWKTIQPFLMKNWEKTYSHAKPVEKKAFLQALLLRRKNNVDHEWFEGVLRTRQSSFKVVMSLILQLTGSKFFCNVCKTRSAEKRRNCMILPPEAAKMNELQEVINRQCVNCYLAACSTCKFFASGKQTPVPLPHQPAQRPQQQPPCATPPGMSLTNTINTPRIASFNPSPAKKHPVATKPISQTPVPLPIMRTAPAPPARPMPPQTGQSQVKPIGIIPCSEHMVTGSEHTSAQSMDGLGGIDLGRGRESTGSVIDAYKVVNESDSSLTRPSTASSSAQSYDESGHNVLSSHTSHTVARSAHLTNSSVLAQAFKVLAEVKQLPHAQQGGTYQKISQALEIIRVPSEDVTVALPNHQQIVPAADHWEVAPGHLARQDLSHAIGTLPPVAFSTFLLRREVVNFDQAQHISSGQKVLNKHVPPSACVRMCESKADWTCVLSVLQGVINVKTPGLNANIGQGGVVLVTLGLESLFTNTTDQEAKIQFWWTKAD